MPVGDKGPRTGLLGLADVLLATEGLLRGQRESVGGVPVEIVRRGKRTDNLLVALQAVRNARIIPHNAPLLGKDVRTAGRKRRMLERRLRGIRARLVEHATGLELDVLSVRVRQQVFPDAAGTRERPQEDLASVLLAPLVLMVGADLPVRPPDGEVPFVSTDDMIALSMRGQTPF